MPNHLILLLLLPVSLISCREKIPPRIDLAKLNLKKKMRTLIHYDNKVWAGVNTVETLPAIVVDVMPSSAYSFNVIPLVAHLK